MERNSSSGFQSLFCNRTTEFLFHLDMNKNLRLLILEMQKKFHWEIGNS